MATPHPFSPVCTRAAFLATPAVEEILRRFDDRLGDREPFLVVTGEPGVGKSALAAEITARWGELVSAAWLAYPALEEDERIEEITRRFGGETAARGSRSDLLASFERAIAAVAARGQVAVLVVDDAHALPASHLESLRMLANVVRQAGYPFEVLLLGLPGLDARLDELPLASLRQRVAVRAKLEPLSAGEVRRYLQHRVGAAGGDGIATFPKKTCREVASRTGGLPRRIDALAAESLRVARVRGDASVTAEHVEIAAATLGGFAAASLAEEAEEGDAASARAVASPAAEATAPAPKAAIAPPPVAKAPQAPVALPPSPAVATTKASPPSAPPAKVAPKPAAPPAPIRAAELPEEEAKPVITPSAEKQDPQEWIARFVGDKGPLQIGAHSGAAPTWVDPVLVEAAAAADQAEAESRTAGGGRGPRRKGVPAIAAVVLGLLVVITAAVLLLRSGILARDRASRTTGSARAQVKSSAFEPPAVAPLPAPVVGGTSSTAPRPDAVVEGSSTTAQPPDAGAESSAADAAAPASANRRYTIDVATRRDDLESAMAERDRLASLTGIKGWVVPDANGGYKIVIGIFRSEGRCAAAARMLVNSKTLGAATVIPIPPSRVRQ